MGAVHLLHDLGREHLVGRTAGAHAAVQTKYLVEATGQVSQVVSRHKDYSPLVPEGLEDPDQGFLSGDVNPAEGLIQQEYACLLGQRPANEYPLPLSSRKLRYQSGAMIPQAHTAQARFDDLSISFPGPPELAQSAATPHHDNVLRGHGEPPVDAVSLGHICQCSAFLSRTAKGYLALVNREEAGNSIEKSAFAGPIRSNHAHQGPRIDVEGDVVQGQVPTELDSYSLKRYARSVWGRIGDYFNAPTMRSTLVRTMSRYVSAPLPSGPREPE